MTPRQIFWTWYSKKMRKTYLRQKAGFYLPNFDPSVWIDLKEFEG